MPARPRLLLLGGTGEARALADRLDADGRCEAITSLAGRTRAPLVPAGAMRLGGFGGADGLADYLRQQAIDAVIDATHPYAAQISHHAAAACARVGVPRLTLQRPPWQAGPEDRWIQAASTDEAAALLPRCGRRVFLGLGRQHLAPFATRPGVWYLIRSIEPTDNTAAFPDAIRIQARGPFDLAGETALLRGHAIDCVVSRNSGGSATYGKIEAARNLGLPVIMIARPTRPDGAVVGDNEAALRWIADKLHLHC